MRKLSLLFVFASALLLVACQNTVKGLGEDMQNTGQAIQKSVK